MRTIKFRGKRLDNGEWVYGYYAVILNKLRVDSKETIIITPEGYYEVLPDSVGQWTGLVDRNGKEIFEGDIISRENTYENNCVVKWDDESCGFTLNYIYFDESYNMNEFWDDFEVIGNIHDNPELLEV